MKKTTAKSTSDCGGMPRSRLFIMVLGYEKAAEETMFFPQLLGF